jgi:hypothetical protein
MPKFRVSPAAMAAVLLTVTINSSCLADEITATPSQAFSHEQQWIVNSIGQDVAEILLFAARQDGRKDLALNSIEFKTEETPGNTEKFSYQLSCPAPLAKESRDFTLATYVWSPDNYSPWAQQLISSFHLHPYDSSNAADSSVSTSVPSESATDASASKTANPSSSSSVSTTGASADAFIADLSKFTPESIAEQNKRISSALTAHALDSRLHEQAALLCSLFALRETASCFNDVRSELNRIAAHLAIAKALNGGTEYGAAGKLADIALMTLSGREAEAVVKIDSMIPSSSEAVQSWLRALKVRATNDYRIADLKKSSPLECLQYGRALADDIGADYLTEYLEKNKPEGNAIDWLRIGSRGVSTVQSGHVYIEPGVMMEELSFNQDFQLYKNKKIESSEEANAALSLFPDRCLSVNNATELQVISWSDICAFHARHLLDSLFQQYYFESKRWGVPDRAKALLANSDKSFSTIRLYPLLKICFLWTESKKSDAALISQCKTLMTTRPQDVNSTLWHRMVGVSANSPELPSVASWFVPRFPFGTAFDFPYRAFHEDQKLTMSELDTLKSENPYDAFLLKSWAGAKYPHDSYTSAQLAEALGVQAEVNVNSMLAVARASRKDPASYGELMGKVAAYKPEEYFVLAQYYVDHSQPESAKKAYESGMSLGKDSVLKSNNCAWLVDYYYDHGEKDKAVELAKFASDVYSAQGLLTAAKLYERMDKLPEAEQFFKNNSERYDTSAELCLFYKRHQNANAKYKQEAERLAKSIFPDGLIKVDVSTMKNPPEKGILINSTSSLTQKYGLNLKDVIVAIENVRVADMQQYFYMLSDAKSTTMQFIVWDGKSYRTVEATLPERKWKCRILRYDSKAS